MTGGGGGGVGTFRTWKSRASLHRLQKRGSSRCSTVSLPNIVTTLHMICRGKHMDTSMREKHHMAFRSSTAGYVFEPSPKYNADALWLPSFHESNSLNSKRSSYCYSNKLQTFCSVRMIWQIIWNIMNGWQKKKEPIGLQYIWTDEQLMQWIIQSKKGFIHKQADGTSFL